MALLRTNALRRGLHGEHAPSGRHKEWFHLSLALPEGLILCNFSLMEHGTERIRPRLALLWRTARWHGGVWDQRLEDCTAVGGELRLAFGPHAFGARDQTLCVRAEDPTGRLRLEVEAEPVQQPTLPSSIRLGRGSAMHWVVVPRLRARGTVWWDGEPRAFEGAPAYHDHNWGHFDWGQELRWDWGYVHDPAGVWDLVLVRVSDGRGLRTLSQGLLVWRREIQVRTFQDPEIRVAHRGVLRQFSVLRVPPVVRLAARGVAGGVPGETRWAAEGAGDRVGVRFVAADHAQVLIPADDDPFGLVRLDEVHGHYEVTGSVRGEAFAYTTPGLLEHVRHG